MNDVFFAIVIGAGPAGASAASVLCEKKGLRVALVDREQFPRDKCCGDGLGPGVVECLKRLGLLDKLSHLSAIKNASVGGPSGVEASGYLPTIGGKTAIGYVVPRKQFDHMLFENSLQLGANDFSGHACTGIRFDSVKGLWTVTLKRMRDGYVQNLYCRVLIGADGATSKVRRFLGVPLNSTQTTGVGLRAYGLAENSVEELRLDFIRSLLPAYGWIFPVGDGVVNFGIGIDALRLQRSDKALRQLLDEYHQLVMDRYRTSFDLTDLQSAPLPYAAPISKLAFNDGPAALIGDAGSMINPLSGEGIFYGMYAGIACAEALHGAFDSQIPLVQALETFEQNFKDRFARHFESNWKMKQKLASPMWSNLAIKACARDQTILDDFLGVMMGDQHKVSLGTMAKIIWYGLS